MIYVCLCSYLTDKCWKILQERWTSRIYVYLYRRFDSICMKGGSEIYSFNQLFTDYKGRSRYAFSISAPVTRMTDKRIQEIIPLVLQVKKEIEQGA